MFASRPFRNVTASVETPVVLSVLLVVLIVSMVWYATHRQPEERIVYTPLPTPTPKPLPPRHLAPEGTFYLLNYLSVPTNRGVVGFEPGREVTLVGVHESAGTLLVTDGKYQVEARPTQLTNDMDIAALARNQDERSQQSLASFVANEQSAYQNAKRQIELNHAANVDKINAALAESSGIGRRKTALDEESQPASSYDRYLLRNGNPYYYLYHRQYNATSPYYYY